MNHPLTHGISTLCGATGPYFTEGQLRFLEAMPRPLIARVGRFLLDNGTGNIQINVKEGRIMGFHLEEIHNLKG